jgi:hypothetical protein
MANTAVAVDDMTMFIFYYDVKFVRKSLFLCVTSLKFMYFLVFYNSQSQLYKILFNYLYFLILINLSCIKLSQHYMEMQVGLMRWVNTAAAHHFVPPAATMMMVANFGHVYYG